MKNLSEHSVPHKERVTSHSVSHLLMSLPPEATVRVGEATVSAPGLQAFDGGLAELNSVKPEPRAEGTRFVGQEYAIFLRSRFLMLRVHGDQQKSLAKSTCFEARSAS